MKNINTVIFDMDGTILDTLEDLTGSVNYVLQSFGMPPRTLNEYRQFFGNGIRHAARCAALDGTSDEIIDEMIPAFKEYYNRHCLDNTRPYDGVLDVMRQLKNKGFKLAIVSNKIDSAVKELNDRFFSEFVDVAIGERNGVNRKPAADMVLTALAELESDASQAVYVGDSEVDIETAKNSGLPCIAVLWGFRDKDRLSEAGAKIYAEKPEDILNILQN